MYIKKKDYSNFCTFEIASLVNVPGHYLKNTVVKGTATEYIVLI